MVFNRFICICLSMLSLSLTLQAATEYKIIELAPPEYKPGPEHPQISTFVYDLSESGYVVGSVYGYPESPKKFQVLSDMDYYHHPITKGFIYHPEMGFKLIHGPEKYGNIKASKVNNNGVVLGRWLDRRFLEEHRLDWSYSGIISNYRESYFVYDYRDDYFLDILSLDWERGLRVEALYGEYEKKMDDAYYLKRLINDRGRILFEGDIRWEKKTNVFDLYGDKLNVEFPSTPIAFNNSNEMIGTDWFYSEETGFQSIKLAASGGHVAAELINDNGVVAGVAGQDRSAKGFVWSKLGESELFPLFDGDIHRLHALNSLNQVVGFSETRNRSNRPFLHEPNGVTLDLGTLGGKDGCAYDINDSSQIVGTSDAKTRAEGKKAFIWSPEHGMRDLNDLIPPNSGWKKLTEATAINNMGYIVGEGIYQGEERAFLLIPLNVQEQ